MRALSRHGRALATAVLGILLLAPTATSLYLREQKKAPSVTKISTDVVYVTHGQEFRTIVKRDPDSGSSPLVSSSNCGTGLLLCEVEDPTRLEAPWRGVSSPLPQCYDPALYTCADNFLCPINAPKISGQYACGPYNSFSSNSTTAVASPVPSGSTTCGVGLLVCQVEDPTRLEAPWHGVSAAFPQCFDPALYTCADNFLCPINAPKIAGEYACGPYETLSSSNTAIGSNTGTSPVGSSSTLSSFISGTNTNPFSRSSSSASFTSSSGNLSITSIPPKTSTEPNGSLTTISGSIETLSSSLILSNSSTPSVSTILPTTSTEPNGSLTTISGSTETLPPSSATQSSPSVTSIPPITSTEPNGSLTTISGSIETLSSSSAVGSSPSLTTIKPQTSTEPNGSLTTIPGTTEPISTSPESLTTIPPETSTLPDGSVTTVPGTTEPVSSPSLTTILPSVSTEPDGSLTTIPGTTEPINSLSLPSGSQSLTTILPSVSTEPDGSLTTIPGTTEPVGSLSFPSGSQSLTTILPSVSTEPDGSLTTIPGTTEPIGSLSLPSGGSTIPPTTFTEPDGVTVVSSSGIIIIGTDTFTAPTGLTTPVTVTTDGETFTFLPTQAVSATTSSTSSSTSVGPLTTFTTWPPGATIIPVTTSVDNPKQTDGGTETTCHLWFFFICIQSDNINIGGWLWILPPGIYPPGPPPPSVIKLPPSISIEGTLPPWPKFTIGPDSIPTYPSEPDNNQCETESASLCATTTSIGPSTTNVAATCATILGCDVQNSATTATTACSQSTVTDYFVSCLASSCTTTSSSVITGCSVTASATTTSSALTGSFCELGGTTPELDVAPTAECTGCTTVSNIVFATSVPTTLTSLNVMNSIDPSQETTAVDKRVAALVPRAGQPTPLLTPNDFRATRGQQEQFIRKLETQVQGSNNILIKPRDIQLTTWTINGVPIGVTGLWFPFGSTPQVYRMFGLHGCTAVFIVSQNGFWAGHFWESSTTDKINSGSSFLVRLSATDVEPRTDEEFQSIAVDILTQDTPANQVANRDFTSLSDLRNNQGNPFANGADVDILVMTVAKSLTDLDQTYGTKIDRLQTGLTDAIPGSNYNALTYVRFDTPGLEIPSDFSGLVTIQYTPFQGFGGDGCTQYAAARVWAELNGEPAIDKTWAASDAQKGNLRKRQACALPSSSTTPSSTISPSSTMVTTTSPSQTPSTTAVACTSVVIFQQEFLDIFYCECDDDTWNHWLPQSAYSTCRSQSASRTISLGTSPPASVPLSACTGVVWGPDPPAFGEYFSTACRCDDYYLGDGGCPDSISAPTRTLTYSAPSGLPGPTFTTDTTAPICTDPVAKAGGVTCTPPPPITTPPSTTSSLPVTVPPTTSTTTLPDSTVTITIPLSDECEHIFTDTNPFSTTICTSSTSTDDLATPLPTGVWTCITTEFTICYCGPDSLPCLPPNEIGS